MKTNSKPLDSSVLSKSFQCVFVCCLREKFYCDPERHGRSVLARKTAIPVCQLLFISIHVSLKDKAVNIIYIYFKPKTGVGTSLFELMKS